MSLFRRDFRINRPSPSQLLAEGAINKKYFQLAGHFGLLGNIVLVINLLQHGLACLENMPTV